MRREKLIPAEVCPDCAEASGYGKELERLAHGHNLVVQGKRIIEEAYEEMGKSGFVQIIRDDYGDVTDVILAKFVSFMDEGETYVIHLAEGIHESKGS